MFNAIKKIFYFVLVVSLLGSLIWFYIQRKIADEKSLIEEAFKNNDYSKIIEFYQDVKISSKSKNQNYLRKCYQKAFALQKYGNIEDAKKYWDLVTSNSDNESYKSNADFFIGQYYFNKSDFAEAEKYFNTPALLNKTCEYYSHAQYYLAKIEYDKKDIDNSRKRLLPLIKITKDSDILKQIKALLGTINIERLYTRRITDNSIDYVILNGDILANIAQNYNTTVELIMKTNNYSSPVIRPNNHIKIVTSIFSIEVSKSKNILTVYENGDFFKEYVVGTGRDNVTPIGTFKIVTKQVDPTWYRHDGKIIQYGDPENFLGTRWMSINYPGYGIHGTWDDESVGKQSSAGCIRLRNKEVEELFLYIPINTSVSISE